MSRAFLDILIVLVAAKIAAELAERAKIPAVVGEIIAGILIGPSVLGLVHHAATTTAGEGGGVLTILGEIGVILLLLEVGMQMDLRELRAVGRASMQVATVGVVLPMAGGYLLASTVLGLSSNASLFIAAALSATSVGITARVFGDLRALATVEARTVLGAAVADDVMGLVILTVVVRMATGSGSVSVGSVAAIIGVALVFLVATTVVGTLGAPRLFSAIDRYSRSNGTLFALALAFTLGIAELASAAKLAPIVGAFVAGLSLGRSPVAQRIQRELTPVGHLFIPVFFLQIGIDTDVKQFAKGTVLAQASVLIVIAVLGKLAAGWAAVGNPGNRLLMGIGMIPRGEVGLIFASIGLKEAILGNDSYAALLLMVLVTTLITPPLLSAQMKRVRRNREATASPATTRPAGGWIVIGRGEIGLAARPGPEELLPVALEASSYVHRLDPSRELLEWLSDTASASGVLPKWDRAATNLFLHLLDTGSDRTWRFLETTGVLERSLPELADALARRRRDQANLDISGLYRWPVLERIRNIAVGEPDHPADRRLQKEWAQLDEPEHLLLAALLIDATVEDPHAFATAGAALDRLDLPREELDAVGALIAEHGLLPAAAVRPESLDEDAVLRLAAHLGDPERARAMFVLACAVNGLEPWERLRIEELHNLIQQSLALPTVGGHGVGALADRRREEAAAVVVPGVHRDGVIDRIGYAPLAYLLSEDPATIARQVSLLDPVPLRGRFRVGVHSEPTPGTWRVEVSGRDQLGLLAIVTGMLEEARIDVVDAVLATWGDGGALQAFRVIGDPDGAGPDPAALQTALEQASRRQLHAPAVPDALVEFDDNASPWHTLAEVRATDRRGLLHSLAVAFAAAGADVHAARVTTQDGLAFDVFDLTDRTGRKLDPTTKANIRLALGGGVDSRPKRPWRTHRVGTIRKQSGDRAEITTP